ncbi:MAG: hypothetical protein ABIY51_01255 [Ferruginibacter sp.]
MMTAKRIFQVLAILFFLSCQKDISNVSITGNQLPDFSTKVNSSVSGFVTDGNDAAVLGASVKIGTSTTSTDKYGFFEIKNVDVVKTAAVVTVSKNGYFKGIKTFIAENNKAAFFRIKLMLKTNVGTINSTTGGNVTLSNGLIVALPSAAVVNAATNVAYSGSMNVAARWIDPVSADLNSTMPGDLRGITTDGSLKTLTTYGMVAVELTGTSGELLQIAPGKKATITMPIPASILANAPGTIPLWSFDEPKGLWIEEGEAIKTGSSYVGEVSHFSFWNCDVPANYVQFNCTIKDIAGNPIANVVVKLSQVNNLANTRSGITDSSGYVGGAVPANTQLLLQVFSSYNCSNLIYSQTFITTTVNISLGIINIPATSIRIATVSGTATNCTNNPVTNGYIILYKDNNYFRYHVSNTGTFSFTTILCNNTANASFIAEDINSMQQSTSLNYTLNTGTNVIGNLQACGTSTQQFITYTIDGGAAINYTSPADSISGGTSTLCYIGGNNTISAINFSMSTNGIAVGSIQNLMGFSSSQINVQTTIPAPVSVNITEYGSVGQFIGGNFSGTVRESVLPNTIHNIVCSFKVRRVF